MKIQIGYVYLVLPLTGLLLTFYSIHFILNAIKGANSPSQSPESLAGLE